MKKKETIKLTEKIVGLNPYENLPAILGKDMGQAIYELVSEARNYEREKDELIDALYQLFHLIEGCNTHNEPEIYNAKRVLYKHKIKVDEKDV